MLNNDRKLFSFEPIGILKTCFKEKFGIPRQSGLVHEAKGILKLKPDPFYKNAVRTLDSFSHIWLIFIFHKHASKNWKPSIRPPRLGGKQKVGVLASRSPHRPNPIGLSAVKIEKIDFDPADGIEIHVSGVDILDGTPILDIKPYLSYTDSIPDASLGWANATIEKVPVHFSQKMEEKISFLGKEIFPRFRELLIEVLQLDPRPAFQKQRMPYHSKDAQGTMYGFRLMQFDVQWKIHNSEFIVFDLIDLETSTNPTTHLGQ